MPLAQAMRYIAVAELVLWPIEIIDASPIFPWRSVC